MAFTDVWHGILAACESMRDDVTLLTPSSRRPFVVEAVEEGHVVVGFPHDGSETTLEREQFEVLVERIESAPVGLVLDDLPPGIEPYATVLSLSDEYTVDEDGGLLVQAADGGGENPFVRQGRIEPPVPERVYGDLLLLADLLERYDVRDADSLSTERLADLYVLLSEVQWDANEFRRAVGDELLSRVGPGGRLHGRFGTVNRTVRERRTPKSDEVVFAALDEAGVPRAWVTGVDRDKLDVVLAVTDVDESDVYDVTEHAYMQKTDVDRGEKRTRLQGLRDRLSTLETEEAADLRDDVRVLENRLDELLAAG